MKIKCILRLEKIAANYVKSHPCRVIVLTLDFR